MASNVSATDSSRFGSMWSRKCPAYAFGWTGWASRSSRSPLRREAGEDHRPVIGISSALEKPPARLAVNFILLVLALVVAWARLGPYHL